MSALAEAAALVEEEADRLDRRAFRDWLALFAPDAWYWVPISPDQDDPAAAPSHLYERRPLIEARVERLMAAKLLPQSPPSRTVRIMGPVRAEEVGGDRLRTRAKFIMVESRILHEADDEQRLLAGTCAWDLVRGGDGLRIASKRVDLVNSEGGLRGLTVPL